MILILAVFASSQLKKDLLLSWGMDGKLCLWDSFSIGQIGAPICVLISNDKYPIYAVDIYERAAHQEQKDDSSKSTDCSPMSTIAIAGGNEGGFIGVPVSLYNF